jgi:hypothetical protein
MRARDHPPPALAWARCDKFGLNEQVSSAVGIHRASRPMADRQYIVHLELATHRFDGLT